MQRSNFPSCAHERIASFFRPVCDSTQCCRLSVLISLLLFCICCATSLRFANFQYIAHQNHGLKTKLSSELMIRPVEKSLSWRTLVQTKDSELAVYQCPTLIDIGESHFQSDNMCCARRFTAADPVDDLVREVNQFLETALTRLMTDAGEFAPHVLGISILTWLIMVGSWLPWKVPSIYYFTVTVTVTSFAACLSLSVLLVRCFALSSFLTVLQSIALMAQIGFKPIHSACYAISECRRVDPECVASWLELTLYMVSWVVLVNGLESILIVEFNPWLKVIAASTLFCSVCFTPSAISQMRLSPISRYLALNSSSGFSLAVAHVGRATIETFSSFKPPR